MSSKRLIICCVTLFLLVFCLNTSFAAVTGKISGNIVDAETGNPLVGANVIVVGTHLGAATDINGYYNILNIPPGMYNVQVTMMGYRNTIISNVFIRIDLTTTVNADMQPTVLDASEAVTVVAERELVQPDMTGSMASMNSDEINNLPVQSVSDVLELQAGVVRDGGDFHIRGGRANEVTFWVDGVEVTDVYEGESMGARIENSAIQELQVVSGTFNAEYGRAMSGIVNIITKEGGKKYSGRINAYAGDYISNDDVYAIVKDVQPGPLNEEGNITEIETLENPLDELNLTLNTDVSLSGPIPGLGDKLSFFVNGRYVSSDGYLYGCRWFTPQGLPGDKEAVAMDPSETYSILGKLTYQLNPNVKMNYQLMWDHNYQSIRGYSRGYKYVPDGLRQNESTSYTHMFSLTHTLSQNTFYELKLARMYRETSSYLYEDPEATPNWFVTWQGGQFSPYTTEGQALLDSLQQNDLPYGYVIDPDNAEGYVDPDYTNTATTYSFQSAGTENTHTYRDYGFINAKLDLTSQVTPVHQLKAGFDAKLHELKLDEYTLISKKNAAGTEELIPYQTTVPLVSSLSRDLYNYEPLELSAYLQDKLELKEMIINIGLRFDYFDADATIPTDIRDPDIYRPISNSNIYKDWDQDYYNTLSQAQKDAYKASLTEYTVEERKAFMRKDVDPKWSISPRIGIAYPITDKGIIHFSYGHFLGMPGFQYLYNDADYKMQSGGGNRLIGNPDLEPEKTVHYEIGLQQQLGDDIGMDVTVFYKDTRDWVGSSPLYETYSSSIGYSKYVNKDYSNVYGLTLDLEKRFSRSFSARVYYSYQRAEGTYSNPNDAYDSVYNSSEPDEARLALVPMDWDQNHTLNAYITYTTKGWTFTATEKFQSGRPYTPAIAKAEQTGGSSYVGWTSNSERIPASSSLDIRVLKAIPVGSLDLKFYVVAYNVLDQRGIRGVFAASGKADYDPNTYADYAGYNAQRVGSYNEQLRRPDYYQAPRHVQVGLSVEF